MYGPSWWASGSLHAVIECLYFWLKLLLLKNFFHVMYLCHAYLQLKYPNNPNKQNMVFTITRQVNLIGKKSRMCFKSAQSRPFTN